MAHGIAWEWIDQPCDHILIAGHVDYYLGKTYWFDRETRKSGYRMAIGLNLRGII